jgi:prephenate dehydrogenase
MKIVILGLGHMGSWFAENLKWKHRVAVFDRIPQRAEHLQEVIHLQRLEDIRRFQPELLLNAVNIQNTIEAFEAARSLLSEDCLLADITSVKGSLPEYYADCGFRFVSIHPMFGPTFANVERLKEENVIIIKDSDPEGVRFFREFFTGLGLTIYEYSFAEHDRLIAYSLTVPFVSTLVFADHMSSAAVPGTTFKKHLHIARGLLREDDYLLTEILFNPHSLPQLEKITQRLEFLKHIIRERDFEEARKFFNRLRENIGLKG